MNRVATPGYLRFPHVRDDLLAFVAEDDVWLAPADGGRAWRLTSDGGQATHPRFSPDGAVIARTSSCRVQPVTRVRMSPQYVRRVAVPPSVSAV